MQNLLKDFREVLNAQVKEEKKRLLSLVTDEVDQDDLDYIIECASLSLMNSLAIANSSYGINVLEMLEKKAVNKERYMMISVQEDNCHVGNYKMRGNTLDGLDLNYPVLTCMFTEESNELGTFSLINPVTTEYNRTMLDIEDLRKAINDTTRGELSFDDLNEKTKDAYNQVVNAGKESYEFSKSVYSIEMNPTGTVAGNDLVLNGTRTNFKRRGMFVSVDLKVDGFDCFLNVRFVNNY